MVLMFLKKTCLSKYNFIKKKFYQNLIKIKFHQNLIKVKFNQYLIKIKFWQNLIKIKLNQNTGLPNYNFIIHFNQTIIK